MKYTLYFYDFPGGKQIEEIIDSKNESVLTETITATLDEHCGDPERMYHLYDEDRSLILSDDILEL